MNSKLLAAVLLLSCGLALSGAEKKVVCYFGSWSVYRQGLGNFPIESIDPQLCTHLVYSFVGINGDGTIRILDQNAEIDKGGFRRFNALKSQNPKLKTLVAIGGYNEGSVRFSQVASAAHLRTAFVNNAVTFVQTHGFDGFDLDWEYPSRLGGAPGDKANFALLIKEFREVFDRHNLLITAAVGATASAISVSYDVPALSKYLHFINIMAYDLHGAFDGITGENAPLYPSSHDVTPVQKEANVDAVLKSWIANGAQPEKLVLGIGVYGRSFTLANPANNGIGAPSSGPGNQGPYTLEDGMLGYNEICELQKNGQFSNIVWNEEQQVPYAFSGNQWVGYDNPRSVALKVAHGNKLNIGGYMIWSIETDDFRGVCGPKYPILTAINQGI
jgi:chitinase